MAPAAVAPAVAGLLAATGLPLPALAKVGSGLLVLGALTLVAGRRSAGARG